MIEFLSVSIFITRAFISGTKSNLIQLKRQSGGGSFRKQFKSYENEAPVQKYNTDVDIQLGKRKKGLIHYFICLYSYSILF